jgi:hypothetical protein
MLHYCPNCSACSWHDKGAWSWALECPRCGTVAKQHPHPPARATVEPAPAVDADEVREDGTRMVSAEAVSVVALDVSTGPEPPKPQPRARRRGGGANT